jgi:DNA-binding MarR family transcriptional regulator
MPGHLIRRLQQRSTQLFQLAMKQMGYDLTSVQFAAMQVLKENPGLEQAQMAELIAYDRATIGGVIDRLEKKGYVLRVVSPQDRRAREVSLTESGEAVLADVYPVIEALQQDILQKLDSAEQQQFLTLAKKVIS